MAGLNLSSMFAEGLKRLNDGTIDWDTHVVKALLMKRSFFATAFTDTLRDTGVFVKTIAAADRASTTKVTLTSAAVVVNRTDNSVYLDAVNSIQFPTVANGTVCRGLVIFKSSAATESTSPLICAAKFTTDVTADGGTVTVNFDAKGVVRLSY